MQIFFPNLHAIALYECHMELSQYDVYLKRISAHYYHIIIINFIARTAHSFYIKYQELILRYFPYIRALIHCQEISKSHHYNNEIENK